MSLRFTQVTDDVLFRPKFKLEAELKEFMKMKVKVAEVSFGDGYANPYSAYKSLKSAAKRYSFPIEVYVKKGHVYLVRVDMK